MDPKTLADTLRKKLSDGFRLSNPKYAPDNICELMQSCWHEDPEKRPTFVDIKIQFKNHYHLKDITEDMVDGVVQDEQQPYKGYMQRQPSLAQLKYAQLLLQRESLKKRFKTLNRRNSTT